MPLPLPPTPLIGRAKEVADAEARLRDRATRLLTLIGPPGVGKTRLALALAHRRAETDGDTAIFVALDTVGEAALVPAAIARALGLRETPNQSLVATLHTALRDRRLLLVLDNFEHVTAAAEVVGDLLAACPDLQILVTSRTALRLRAETLLAVEPLALPASASASDGTGAALATISQAAAVQLFLARAQAVRPTLILLPETAHDIATICARLDGLPLAIELAAARSRIFSPRELVERLDARLTLLTGGGPDLPPRQRTLRAAIAWSYDLLADNERRLMRLLSIFPGGGTLDAIVALAQDDGAAMADDLLDALDALIGHSLVRRDEDPDGTSRFHMLETIREFAGEQLVAAGEHDAVWLRLTAWSLTLSGLAAVALTGPDQIAWLARLDAEHDNLRAVLGWTLRDGRVDLGLELAGTLWRYWQMRGLLSEGRDWCTRLLARGPRAPGPLRAAALLGAGTLALDQGDLAGAVDLAEQCLSLFREAGGAGVAEALSLLGRLAVRRSQYAAATAYCEESLALAQADGDEPLVARCLVALGTIALDEGDFHRAREQSEQALALAERLGDLRTVAVTLNNLGLIADRLDDAVAARAYAERSLAVSRRLGNPTEICRTLTLLTMLVRGSGDLDEARAYGEEALALARANGNEIGVATALSQLTAIARALGDLAAAHRFSVEQLQVASAIGYPIQRLSAVTEAAFNAQAAGLHARAVRLIAASEAMREAMGLAQHEGMRRQIEGQLEALRDHLDADSFMRAWAEGSTMSADEACAHALAAPAPIEQQPAAVADRSRSGDAVDGLTLRQREILALLAAGRSNAEIAAQLVLSQRTVEHHVAHIYAKIGAHGRVDAAAYALRRGIVRD